MSEMMADYSPIFLRRRSGRLQIGLAALQVFQSCRQLAPESQEAGGVLLGRYILDSDDIVIDSVTTPQSGDKRSRNRFFRERKQHQALIDSALSGSECTVTYLGEWHTHPEPIPTPSMIDRTGWVRKLMLDHFADAVFFVIVGTVEIGVWEGRIRHPSQTKLREFKAGGRLQ